MTFTGSELHKDNTVVLLKVANERVDVALVEVLLGRPDAGHRERTR